MQSPIAVRPNPVPKVLIQAKKDALNKIAFGRGNPWDKGHWANRK